MIARREAVRRLALSGIGSAALPAWAEALIDLAEEHRHATQAAPLPAGDWVPKFLDPQQRETVAVIVELIIPETDTPGARAAGVDRFVDSVLAAAGESQRREFVRGLRFMDGRSRQLFGAEFKGARPDQQAALLTILSSEKNTAFDDEIGREFFAVMKALSVSGYYGSQIGLEQELGDDGRMVLTEFPGCRHPEHGAPTSRK